MQSWNLKQVMRWSFEIPAACMNEYITVGPIPRKPLLTRSLLIVSAFDVLIGTCRGETRDIPVLAVTQAHLFFSTETSSELTDKHSTSLASFSMTFSVLGLHCFLLADVQDLWSCCFRRIEPTLPHFFNADTGDRDLGGGSATASDIAWNLLQSLSRGLSTLLLFNFSAGLRSSADLALFPAGPSTGRISDSALSIDFTRGTGYCVNWTRTVETRVLEVE
nr:hypothetical protein Iba_chr06bCG8380 [Ipomoea batatas]